MNKILEVKHLKVFPLNEPNRLLVKDISFELYPGRITCIVGESGSGKSLSALSIMKLLSHQLKQTGDILFQGKNISNLSDDAIRSLRGKSISMIFQEPMTSLNPVLTIGDQIKESLSAHLKLNDQLLRNKVTSLLKEVGIPSERMSCYPDELSGGQRQGVAIARAVLMGPSVLLFDEPTSAMDFTTETLFINKMKTYTKGKTLIVTTHRMSLLDLVDRLIVMDQGKIVADGPKAEVLKAINAGKVKVGP